MNILDEILEHQRSEVKRRKKVIGARELGSMPMAKLPRRSLEKALRMNPVAVIAEVKKASPSRGVIRADFDALTVAQQYVENGAVAISVLTNRKYFHGRLEDIQRIRAVVDVPILRKDFIIDRYQLYEAVAYGADAVLLIASVLNKEELHAFANEARALGLECLIEIHSLDEIGMLDFETMTIIGINNRDLKTLTTDLWTSIRLRKHIPSGVLCVSESGIQSPEDLRLLLRNGFNAFLIGESLLRADHPGAALRGLLSSAGKESIG